MATQPIRAHLPTMRVAPGTAVRVAPSQAERLRKAIQTWAIYVATSPGTPQGTLRSEVIDRSTHVVHSVLDWTEGKGLLPDGVLPCDDGSLLLRANDGTWKVSHDHWENRTQGHALHFIEGHWYRFVVARRQHAS